MATHLIPMGDMTPIRITLSLITRPITPLTTPIRTTTATILTLIFIHILFSAVVSESGDFEAALEAEDFEGAADINKF